MKRRGSRVASLIHEQIAMVLHDEIADPALSGMNVTDVRVTDDLGQAEVFFSIPGTVPDKELNKGIQRVLPFVRRRLGGLGLRRIPSVAFRRDTHTENVQRVLKLLEDSSKTV